MKINVILVALGLHSAVVGADCSTGYDTSRICQELKDNDLNYYSDKNRAEYEEYIQRTRPIQVIEPGGVRTFYPDSSGGSWVTYNPPLRSRR